MPGKGFRQTSSPTSPVPTSDRPASSTTSIAIPSAGPPSEHALIGTDDGTGPHDPAHVGREVDDVARADVGLVADLACDRDEEAALNMDDALRHAGRAGGVRQQIRRLRRDLEGRQLARIVVELERG